MRKRRRTEVTVETDEVWVIRLSESAVVAFCAECGKEVGMITLEEAVILAGVTPRSIYRRVEAGLIHYMEAPGGFLFVCADSITRLATKPL